MAVPIDRGPTVVLPGLEIGTALTCANIVREILVDKVRRFDTDNARIDTVRMVSVDPGAKRGVASTGGKLISSMTCCVAIDLLVPLRLLNIMVSCGLVMTSHL